jgi:hypothetical protein
MLAQKPYLSAASSSASGNPASRQHIAATAPAFSVVNTKEGKPPGAFHEKPP